MLRCWQVTSHYQCWSQGPMPGPSLQGSAPPWTLRLWSSTSATSGHPLGSCSTLPGQCWICQQMNHAKDPSTQLPWCSCSQGRCSSQDWWRDHCHCLSPGRAAPGSADLEWVQSYKTLHNCVATDMLHNQVRLTFNEVILGWIIS